MAQKTVIQLTDDLDGSQIRGSGGSVQFALDGISYEIDLSDTNAAKLRGVLEPYIAAARRGRSGGARTRRSTLPAASSRDAQGIRDWARQNGYKVSERGRISATVLAAYEASAQAS